MRGVGRQPLEHTGTNPVLSSILPLQHLAVQSGWSAIYPDAVVFLLEQGRMKYCRPLYRALCKVNGLAGANMMVGVLFNISSQNPDSAQLARDTFSRHREKYHPIAAEMIAKDLAISRVPVLPAGTTTN